MFKVEDSTAPTEEHDRRTSDEVRKSYDTQNENGSLSRPSPPGGFVDLGCVSVVGKMCVSDANHIT